MAVSFPQPIASRRRALAGSSCLCLILSGLSVLPAAAQDTVNPLLTFSFSSSLNVSDNYDLSVEKPGTTSYMDNNLGVTYLSETANQRLSFGADGVLRLADYPVRGSETDFDDTRLRFEYERFSSNASLLAKASYNRADIAFFDPLRLIEEGDIIDGDDLVATTGYRETLNADILLRTGLQDPIGFSLGLSTRQRDFIDTDDEDLYDTTTDRLNAGLIFTLSPVTQLTLDGAYSLYSADDEEQTDRDTRSLSLGATHSLARGLTLTGSLGYQELATTETDIFGNRLTTNDDGLIGSLGAIQELNNGTIGIDLDHSINASGARSTFYINRAMELPQGELSLAFGATHGETGKTSPVGNLNYQHILPMGTISASLSHRISSDNDDEDVEITSAGLGLSRDLTPVSGLDLNLNWVETNAEDGEDDRQRGVFRASYRHALTQDWDLTGGYEYTQLNRSTGDAQENSVFLKIGRQFQYRP